MRAGSDRGSVQAPGLAAVGGEASASRHVHVVVTGGPTPEKVMNDLKSYASRAAECGQFRGDAAKTLDATWQYTLFK